MFRFPLFAMISFALVFPPSTSIGTPAPDTDRLSQSVERLASPQFEGRLLGSTANREARAWIQNQAEEAGLLPLEGWDDPIEPFQVQGYRWSTLVARIIDPEGEAYDLVLKSRAPVFADTGALLNWTPGLPAPLCENREILLRDFDPASGDSPSDLLDEAAEAGAGALLLLPHPADTRDVFSRYRVRSAAGDKSVYFPSGEKPRPLLLYGNVELREALDEDPGKIDWHLEIPSSETFALEGGNLVFRLPTPCSGPVVLLIAHFDHLGLAEDGYYPGANDNGSGVAVLLETARLVARRNYPFELRFLFTDGEEEGWLGARAYLEQMEAPDLVINLDTVGRSGVDHYRKLRDPSAFSPDLLMFWSRAETPVTESLRSLAAKLDFDVRRGEGPIFERAGDHYPFAQAGLPAVFIFGGFHPDYHETGDTPDKVLPEKLARICALLRNFLDEAAADPPFAAAHR